MGELIELRSGSGELSVGIDRASGSLVRLSSAALGWDALGPGRGARPFDLLLTLDERRLNRTRRARQPGPEVVEHAGGTSVELRWHEVVSEAGGRHEIEVTGSYALDGDAIVCRMTLDNHSSVVVENVTFPCLTDLQSPPAGAQLDFFIYAYATARRGHLRPHFTNTPGYFGVDRPTFVPEPFASTVPGSPFVLLDGAGGGLYIGVDTPEPELLTWIAELEPGYSDSIDSHVPPATTIGARRSGSKCPPSISPTSCPASAGHCHRSGCSSTREIGTTAPPSTGPAGGHGWVRRPRRPGRPNRTPGSRCR